MISKNFINEHTTQELQAHFSLEQDAGLIFSYDLSLSSDGMGFSLQQKETAFSLSVILKERRDSLLIKKFTIDDNEPIAYLSQALYDAAFVEIMLQALTALFFIAEQYDLEEIIFEALGEESNHAPFLDRFFQLDEQESEGNLAYVLPTTLEAYDSFVEQTETIKAQIHHDLWKAQRTDHYVRSYLQNHKKGRGFLLGKPSSPANNPSTFMGKILAFPQCTTRH